MPIVHYLPRVQGDLSSSTFKSYTFKSDCTDPSDRKLLRNVRNYQSK